MNGNVNTYRRLGRLRARKVRYSSLCLAVLLILWINKSFYGTSPPINLEDRSESVQLIYKPCLPENKYHQLDPCLISYVKHKLLIPPSGLPLSLPPETTHDKFDKWPGIRERIEFIDKYFIQKGKLSSQQGFFIECGANNGEFISNTLGLERKYNWTGLLVEPNPEPFKQLISLHRNAWAINQGLCTTTHSDQVIFHMEIGNSGPGGFFKGRDHNTQFNVTCVPLYTILLALNVTTVDYFSLDVQGVELEILKTVPLDKVIFKVITLEHELVPGFQNASITFMEQNGYRFIGSILDVWTQDSLFVHESEYTADMMVKVKYQKKPY